MSLSLRLWELLACISAVAGRAPSTARQDIRREHCMTQPEPQWAGQRPLHREFACGLRQPLCLNCIRLPLTRCELQNKTNSAQQGEKTEDWRG